MNVYIQELRADHQRLSRLLNFLRDTLPGTRVRWTPEVIQPVTQCIDYIRSYAVVVHHGKEEVLFRRLAARDSDARVFLDVLVAEHRLLTHSSDVLHQAAIQAENGRPASQETLGNAARDFISTKFRHMRFEEDKVYPLLEARLTLEDWKEAISEMPSVSDPLFGSTGQAGFLPLRNMVQSHARRRAHGTT